MESGQAQEIEEKNAAQELKQGIVELWRKYGKTERTLSTVEKEDAVEGYNRLMGKSKKLQQVIEERKALQQEMKNSETAQGEFVAPEDFEKLDLVLKNAQKKSKNCSIL